MGTKRKRTPPEIPRKSFVLEKPLNHTLEGYQPKPNSLSSHNILPFVEKPTGNELKREVDLYETLASEDEPRRLYAANQIISGLLGEGASSATIIRHLERRLLRGLASGRKGARIGYSIVLTEIFSQIFMMDDEFTQNKYVSLHFERVLLLLKTKTKPEGAASGQEIKDHALGLLFGLQCFVRAKILFQNTEYWKLVLQEILGLAKKKPWIREECGWVIVEAIEQMNENQALITLTIISDQGLSKTPEGVGIWLTIRNKAISLQSLSPPKVWGESANPLDHLQDLAIVLKESSRHDKGAENSENVQQPNQMGSWNPKLHFVWDIILNQFITRFKRADDRCELDFAEFWRVTVDENLFAPKASKERKFWGFLLFQKLLQITQIFHNVISSIFSHNLMRCLINHSQVKDRFLNRAAEKSLKAIFNVIQSHPELLPKILSPMICGHGTYHFDKVSKTKTVSQLLDLINVDNHKIVLNILEEAVNDVQVNDVNDMAREIESRRVILGDYLLFILRKPLTFDKKSPKSIRATVLEVMARYAYTKSNEIGSENSEKIQNIFRNRLTSSFTHLLTDLEQHTYVCDLLKKFEPTAVEMDSGVKSVKGNSEIILRKIQKKLKKSNGDKKILLQAMSLLYSLTIFQLYNGEPEAVSCLEELDLCYQKLIRKKEQEPESPVVQVLVEVLLSFISRPSKLLRRVAQFVFGAFVSQMTEGGLKLMIDVLKTNESLGGQQTLFENEDYSKESLDMTEKDLDTDIELIDMKADEGPFVIHMDEGDSTRCEDDISDDFDSGEETEKLNSALASVLGTNPGTVTESDNSVDMTDSEMFALDDKLVEIFSQRKQKSSKGKEQKNAKDNICNFKTRVLDLIDIYVKVQAHNELAFQLIMPLLNLMRTTKSKNIVEKSYNIIHKFVKAHKKTPPSLQCSKSILRERLELLKKIHEEVSKDPSHAFCKSASSASLLVVSSIYRIDTGLVKKIANIYRDTQIKWVLGQANIQSIFFTEWINWCQSHISVPQKIIEMP